LISLILNHYSSLEGWLLIDIFDEKLIDQNPDLDSASFFIESSYLNENNQTYPCYLLTKKGCDMVANKMTGEKGVFAFRKFRYAKRKVYSRQQRSSRDGR